MKCGRKYAVSAIKSNLKIFETRNSYIIIERAKLTTARF